MAQLTPEQYSKLTCVIAACPYCHAHRGEPCRSRDGKPYSTMSMMHRARKDAANEWRIHHRSQYRKLREQIAPFETYHNKVKVPRQLLEDLIIAATSLAMLGTPDERDKSLSLKGKVPVDLDVESPEWKAWFGPSPYQISPWSIYLLRKELVRMAKAIGMDYQPEFDTQVFEENEK